jgi:predicted phage tail protein
MYLMFSGPIFLVACGGGLSVGGKPGGGNSVSISASPLNTTMVSGKTQQFRAVVSNTANMAVEWSATGGVVDSEGLFTAPVVGSPMQISVQATSQADKTKSATVALTVNPSAATPAPPAPPSPPAPRVTHSVSLSWNSSANPRIVSYSVYRSMVRGTSYGLLASAIEAATHNDQGVQSGTIYYYVVTAVDDAGHESAYSNETRVTIP